MERSLTSPSLVRFVLFFQFVPLLLFPPESFSPGSQEWWLPALLVVLVLVAVVQIVFRRSSSNGPWNLIGFAQGFNIISRLMMLWPHATSNVNGVSAINWPYLLITLVSISLSVWILWYVEKPAVRMAFLR